jgi:deoxyadenosine/deoxycytidine kinase
MAKLKTTDREWAVQLLYDEYWKMREKTIMEVGNPDMVVILKAEAKLVIEWILSRASEIK